MLERWIIISGSGLSSFLYFVFAAIINSMITRNNKPNDFKSSYLEVTVYKNLHIFSL